MQAIETVKNELEGPIALEFQKISLDISYGLSLDTVFNRFYNRVQVEDAKYIASSLTLLNKTGGNIVKVFSMIEKSFFDKKKLGNKVLVRDAKDNEEVVTLDGKKRILKSSDIVITDGESTLLFHLYILNPSSCASCALILERISFFVKNGVAALAPKT